MPDIFTGQVEWIQLRAGMVLTVDATNGAAKVWFRGSLTEVATGAKSGTGAVMVFGPLPYQQAFEVRATAGKVVVTEGKAAQYPLAGVIPVTLTQAEYDALAVKDPATLYVIVG